MDNKLSELSKPVAYTDADELRFHHATSDMWPVPLGFGKDVPLYSQEYVSALLARIAELEQVPTIKHIRSVEESLIRATDMVSELEAKLATPVRLPSEHELHQVSCSECAGNCLELVESTLRAAGFKVEGGS